MKYWTPWFAMALGLLVLAAHNYNIQPWMLDDALISIRYSEHFAQGKGLVYNEGEYVEGYTTFLWVLLLGIVHALGAPLVEASKVLGVLFTVGCSALLAFAPRIAPRLDPIACALASVLCCTSGIITVWSMCGMEVPLVAFWCLLAVLLHLRAREVSVYPLRGGAGRSGWLIASAVACVLATMSRPEAVLVFLVCFCDRLILSARRRDGDFFVFGLVFSAIYLPYFAWRFWYYGHLLPNTFYAKVGDNPEQKFRGWRYTEKFLVTGFSVVGPAFAGLLGLGPLRRRAGAFHLIAAILLVHTAYVVYVGGDIMIASRFYATVLPLFALLGAHAVGPLVRKPLPFIAACLIVVSYNALQIAYAKDMNSGGRVAENGQVVGEWLREHAASDTLIATNTAGSIPFYSKLRTIDTLGLNDETIAHRYLPSVGSGSPGHEKGDGKYVLSRKPDIVQFGSSYGKDSPSFIGDHEISRLPEFRRDYVARKYRMKDGRMLTIYVRKDREEAIGLPKTPLTP